MHKESIFLVIPTMKQGGAERVMSELANHWASLNRYNVHLVLLAKAERFYTLDETITVHNLGFENKGKVSKVISEAKVFFKLRKLIRNIKPLFALSFMEKYNAFTILASLGSGIPVYVSDRSNPKSKVSKKIDTLRNLTYKHAAGIIAQTELAKSVLKNLNKNIVVVHNPLKEIKRFPVEKENIILNIGRMVPQKGQQYLLEAFAALSPKYKDWKVVILGDGPLREQLADQALSLGIADSVLMPGAVKDVDEWLCKASIFAFTSISEGYPNALVEAMSAGLPCISFNCDAGPSDIIVNNVNGFLIEVGDMEALIEKTTLLIENKEVRESIITESEKIAQALKMEKIAQQYLDFCCSSI